MFFKEVKEPSPVKIIESFVKENYPTLKLTPKMFEQLSWLQTNSVNTSQSNVNSIPATVNIEVKRILSRYHSLELLKEGGTDAYTKFVQSQTDMVLSENNFNHLSTFIQQLSDNSSQCLMATCFITKSDNAIKLAYEQGAGDLPSDSEQFITHLVTYYPTVLPICSDLTQKTIDLLPYAFYKNSHARQMLDMEGGYNMISTLVNAIHEKKITEEQYNLWFARWVINIAGLDGHINTKGSIYLTEPVADCIWALKAELDQLWVNAQHNVIDNYLAFRQKQLGVNNIYIAYLGALMRQYSLATGKEIQDWFEDLDSNEQEKKLHVFNTQLNQTKITPTFKPPLLVNLLQLDCNVAEALTLFSEIESQTMALYINAIEKGDISETTPLSYRDIAFKEFLLPIKEYYFRYQQLPEFTLNSDGYLKVPQEALSEENLYKKVI